MYPYIGLYLWLTPANYINTSPPPELNFPVKFSFSIFSFDFFPKFFSPQSSLQWWCLTHWYPWPWGQGYIHLRMLTYWNGNFECVIQDFHWNFFSIFHNLRSVWVSIDSNVFCTKIFHLLRHIWPIQFFWLSFPLPNTFFQPLSSWKNFVNWFICFSHLVFFARLGSSLSNTEGIFLTNINSAANKPELIFGFGMILYTVKNFWILLSFVSTPWF